MKTTNYLAESTQKSLWKRTCAAAGAAVLAIALNSTSAGAITAVAYQQGKEEKTESKEHQDITVDIDDAFIIASIEATEEAMEEVRSALNDVHAQYKKSKNKREKKALKQAASSLKSALKALELQKNSAGREMHAFRIHGELAERFAIEKEALQDALESLADRAEGLADMRATIHEDVLEMREELAEKLEDLREEIEIELDAEDDENIRVIKLRALRSAEINVAEVEKQHLMALKSAEREIARARARLEAKIKALEKREANAKKAE